MKPVPTLMLHPLNAGIQRVMTASGEHVGNLKRIGGVWKFKAVGYQANGDVVPGGGPLTDRHNASFATLDLDLINATLCMG